MLGQLYGSQAYREIPRFRFASLGMTKGVDARMNEAQNSASQGVVSSAQVVSTLGLR